MSLKNMDELVPDEVLEERPLTVVESKRLAELEGVIERNFKGFVEVGTALAEIRESRLYRRKCLTFEGYCQELWEVNRQRAYQLIAASEVVENVKNFLQNNSGEEIPLPSNDAQARELAKLPPEDQVKVWQSIVENTQANGGKITAKAVKKAVKSHHGAALDEYVEKTTRKTREHKEAFQSEQFAAAFSMFFAQVRMEKLNNWKNTSRSEVFTAIKGLLDVVSEVPAGSREEVGCQMELADREKLKKAGFRIFRMDVRHKVIEEWRGNDEWVLFQECDSPKSLHDQFAQLMLNHSHLRG